MQGVQWFRFGVLGCCRSSGTVPWVGIAWLRRYPTRSAPVWWFRSVVGMCSTRLARHSAGAGASGRRRRVGRWGPFVSLLGDPGHDLVGLGPVPSQHEDDRVASVGAREQGAHGERVERAWGGDALELRAGRGLHGG